MKINSKLLKELKEFRHTLHQNPELSGKEHNTSKFVKSYFKKLRPDSTIELSETGVAFQFDSNVDGSNILIRTELDALPIREINRDLDYISKVQGISHKCGHDGHMAIVTGVACLIKDNMPKKGKVTFLYQPAEEIGYGAQAVYDDPNFDKIKPDYVYALHNLPGFESGAILTKPGPFSAASFGMIIKLRGKVSHAAEPEKGINPAYAIADILNHTKDIMQPNPEEEDFALITPIQIRMGEERFGTSAGRGTLKFTLRSFSNDRIDKLEKDLLALVKKRCKKEGLKFKVEKKENFKANLNGEFSSNLIEKIAKRNSYPFIKMDNPFKWSEDFGVFTSKFNGAMFGLGSGLDCPALHNPDYDFPDEIIENGITMFDGIIREILAE